MRIAHVSDCYAPRTGGIETQVAALAQHQLRAGHDIRVITATGGDQSVFAGRDQVDGVDVDRAAVRVPFELPIHPRTSHVVRDLLEGNRPDIVHVHLGAVSPFAWGSIRAATALKLPVLVTVHSIWGPLSRGGYSVSDRWARANHVRFSAVSRVAADLVAAAMPEVGEVFVVPNGIDPEPWRTVSPIPGAGESLRVVSVLRMAPRKRALPLMRILRDAQHALSGTGSVHATVIGDGPNRTRVEGWARRHAPGLVEFTGRLDRQGIIEVFSRSDVFVQPSVRESFGIAALEARTAGLPLVVRSQTGSTQFVQAGVNGLVVSDDAGAVAGLVRLARDRELLSRIALNNRSVPPHEVWPNVLQDVDRAYAVTIQSGTGH